MENIIPPSLYISALSGLNSMLFVKKFGIIQPEILDRRLNDIQAEINERYKSKLGFGIYEVSSPEEILRFGNLINDEYSEITKKSILNYSVNAEIKLLKNAIKIDHEFFKEKKIAYNNQSKKILLKEHNITDPNLISIIRNSSEIYLFNEKPFSEKLYFTKTLISYRKQDHWLVGIIFEMESDNFQCELFFLLKEKKYRGFNTIRLFLTFLNTYCGTFKFNGINNKLILYEQQFSKNIKGSDKLIDFDQPPRQSTLYFTLLRQKFFGMEYLLCLVVNFDTYRKELSTY